MKILVVKPGLAPEEAELPCTLSAMQEVVGGTIQVLYPFDDDVALVCHDEGKLLGLAGNRALKDQEGNVYDVVCGTFFLCGAPAESDSFESLSSQQVQQYFTRFQYPELFFLLDGKLMVWAIRPEGEDT